MTKVGRVALLVSAIALILVILALQLLTPGDTLDQTGPGGARIEFSADHGMVIAPGACVNVHWHVDHIAAVYINDDPTVGEGYRQLCGDDAAMPMLRVRFSDDTTLEIPLQIKFLVEQPTTWGLVSATVLLGLISLYVLVNRSAPSAAPGKRLPWVTSLFAGIGVLVTSIAIMALVAEVGMRFYFGQFGTKSEQYAYVNPRSKIPSAEPNMMAIPFVEFGPSPDYPGDNALGYRGDEIQASKPSGVYRIVTLGESSTYGSFVPYNQTYPYDLQTVLRDDYGVSQVEVVNAGVPGYRSWNMLVDLAFRIAELDPDLVIVYGGFNDLVTRQISPECYHALTPILGLDPAPSLHVQPSEVSPSALYRFLAIHFGWMLAPSPNDNLIPRPLACYTPANADLLKNVKANPPTYFERNLREMVSVAQADDFQIMFMTWITNPNDPHFVGEWRTIAAQYNVIAKRVARERNVPLFDYAAIAPTNKNMWNDIVHFNSAGNLLQAQALAKFLIEQALVPTQAAS